jgi:tetratricopeptide (TPR) repeat protein
MVEQLQKAPEDGALREKIIKLVREVRPAPTVSSDAKRAFVMGSTYQKEAKSPEDFGLAVKAFQDATTAAPWWGDAYYNLSVALESAKRYDEAKSALALYLLTNPKDAEQAQERLYALDAKRVLLAKQEEAVRIAATAEDRKKNSIEGYWFVVHQDWPFIQIVRNGDAMVVKPGGEGLSVFEAQATETSVRMKVGYRPFGPDDAVFLYVAGLRGGDLIGTSTNLTTNRTTQDFRLVRKPWPTK